MSEKKEINFSCTTCGVQSCHKRDKNLPGLCLSTNKVTEREIEKILELYRNDPQISKLAKTAAVLEGTFYGKLTRVEEIIEFAHRIGARKIGIATCVGLIQESKVFAKLLEHHGFQVFGVLCKVGGRDKTEIGIPAELKVLKGCHESMCNPILQAKQLAKAKTDLNVVVGLCVGHDSLFMKYSKAPVTTLITKDRVTGHNPAAPLYLSNFYYAKLFNAKPVWEDDDKAAAEGKKEES